MATIKEIANSHGFNTVTEYVKSIQEITEKAKLNAFKIDDNVVLKEDCKSTSFNCVDLLPNDGRSFKVAAVSSFTFDDYFIKLEGYDSWVNAEIFKSL